VLSSSDLTISPADKKKKAEMNKDKIKNLNDTRKKEKRKEWGPLLDDLLIHTSSSKQAAPALPLEREQPNFLYGNMQKTNFFPLLVAGCP
jgi:hypothetical protein